jgi:hypothetical protein
VSREEFRWFWLPDLRLGGFGPLFNAMLCAAVLLAGTSLSAGQRQIAAISVCAAGVLLLSAMVSGHAWWARLVPQVWLAPFMVALGALMPATARPLRLGAGLLLGLGAINALGVALMQVRAATRAEAQIEADLHQMRAQSAGLDLQVRYFEAVRFRLDAAGVDYRVVDELRCAEPRPVERSDASWCPRN